MAKNFKNTAPAEKVKEAVEAPKLKRLEAIISVILQPKGSEGSVLVAPGGVFEASDEIVKKLVDKGSARITNMPASTKSELDNYHEILLKAQKKQEKDRLAAIRQANS